MELLQDLLEDFIELASDISCLAGTVNMCLPEKEKSKRELSDDELFELEIKNKPKSEQECLREIREIHNSIKKSLKM